MHSMCEISDRRFAKDSPIGAPGSCLDLNDQDIPRSGYARGKNLFMAPVLALQNWISHGHLRRLFEWVSSSNSIPGCANSL